MMFIWKSVFVLLLVLTLGCAVLILAAGAAGHLRDGEIITFSGSDTPGLNYEGIFLLDIYMGITHNLIHHSEDVRSFSWSPNGTEVLFISNRYSSGDMYLMKADGRNLRRLTSGYSIPHAAWSPDGQTIAFVSPDVRSGLWDIFTVSPHIVEDIPQNLTNTLVINERYVAWSPDSSRIAYNADGSIFTLEVSTHTRQRLAPTSQYSFPTWSPNGQYIAHWLWNSTVELFSPENAIHLPETVHTSEPIMWSPNGKILVAVLNNFSLLRDQAFISMVYLDDLYIQGMQTSLDRIDSLSWSPDGNQIAFSATIHYPHFQQHIYILEVSTGEIRQVVYHPWISNSPLWKP